MLDLLKGAKITQIGYLVHDAAAAVAKYEALLGQKLNHQNVTDPYEQSQCTYNGRRCDGRAICAFFNLAGGMAIELIEPDEAPSVWRDDLNSRGEGIHHIAFHIKGMAEMTKKCEEAGFRLLQKGEYTGGRYAYFDADSVLGARLELLEND